MIDFFFIPLAVLIDALFGDPSFPTHPVIWIGRLITRLEKALLPPCRKKPEREVKAGKKLVLLTCLFCTLIPFALWLICYRIKPLLADLFSIYVCFILLAGKSLSDESEAVREALVHGSLEKARAALSRIVGRDTENLSREGVIKAAVETVAENTSDGIVAPLFYFALLGPAGMFLYKGINTMDSMVGYKNKKYLYFGRAAAKLDDIANFLPSRLCAFLMIAASFLCRLDAKGALRIFKRDRFQHASPNSGQTEAVMAGALGVELAGPAVYFGERVDKPTIGDALRPVQEKDIRRAGLVMWVTEILAALLLGLLYGVLH